MKQILLIYPPWTRNASPPIGLGMLQGDIGTWGKQFGVQSRVLDLNALAAIHLPDDVVEDGSHRTHRSILHKQNTIRSLRDPSTYRNHDRYRKIMSGYRDLLAGYAAKHSISLTPGDFVDHDYEDFGPESLISMIKRESHPLLNPVIDLFEDTINRVKPDLIGISIVYRSQISAALALCGWIQRRQPETKILLGGGFMSCLSDKSIDILRSVGLAVVIGNGEPVLRNLFGISSENSSRFPKTDFTGIDFSHYFSPVRTLPMVTSRGCYWGKCAFCDECKERFFMDRPDNFINRIEQTLIEYSPHHIHFTDHAIPPTMLTVLSHLDENVTWSGFVRATRELTDFSFVKNLAAAGCKMLQLGFETPVQHLLQSMNKGVDSRWFPIIIRHLRDAGIRSFVYMLFGYPGQTLDDWEEALRFLEDNPPDYLNTSIFRFPPNAPGSQNVSNSFKSSRSNDRLYFDLESEDRGLPELRRWISKRLKVSEKIRQVIKNTPQYYKSSHAAYF